MAGDRRSARAELSPTPTAGPRVESKDRPNAATGCNDSAFAALEKCQPAYKPGFVWPSGPCGPENVAAIHLGPSLPTASRNLPGRWAGNSPEGCPSTAPIRFCSRWGLPCRFRCRSRGGLLPHPFTLTPKNRGGLLSVALSLGSPPPAVSRHRVSMEPGLSSPATFRFSRVRPPGRLAGRIKAFAGRKAIWSRR